MPKKNNYQVIVSTRAAQMLISHTACLAEVYETAAENLASSFNEAASSLERMPQRCPWLIGN